MHANANCQHSHFKASYTFGPNICTTRRGPTHSAPTSVCPAVQTFQWHIPKTGHGTSKFRGIRRRVKFLQPRCLIGLYFGRITSCVGRASLCRLFSGNNSQFKIRHRSNGAQFRVRFDESQETFRAHSDLRASTECTQAERVCCAVGTDYFQIRCALTQLEL